MSGKHNRKSLGAGIVFLLLIVFGLSMFLLPAQVHAAKNSAIGPPPTEVPATIVPTQTPGGPTPVGIVSPTAPPAPTSPPSPLSSNGTGLYVRVI